MRFGTGKALGALAPIVLMLAVLTPAADAANPDTAVRTSIKTLRGQGATAAATVTYLTVNGLSGVDNRITVFNAPSGRLTLIAPEGLMDPDGPNAQNCQLDNPMPGQSVATEISCAPGYAQVIVGDLSGGNDSFTSAPDLTVAIGSVIAGVRRSMSGGIGEDRIVGGAALDLLDGGAGEDNLIANLGEDLLSGGGAKDRLNGGGDRDALYGGGGSDKLNGGPARDFCNGGASVDVGQSCNVFQSIP